MVAGSVFGRLTVVCEAARLNGKRQYLCQCSCGKTKEIAGSNLTTGHIRSCGCLSRELASARNRIHGGTGTVEYDAWCRMIRRCECPTDNRYRRYGARGISVCERWRHSFANFLADVGLRPSNQHSIERLDNDGNYEPSNTTWATRHEQAVNKQKTVRLTINGQTKKLIEWCEIYSMPVRVAHDRIRSGIDPEVAMLAPVHFGGGRAKLLREMRVVNGVLS